MGPLHDSDLTVLALRSPYIAYNARPFATGHGRDNKRLFTFRATKKAANDFSSHLSNRLEFKLEPILPALRSEHRYLDSAVMTQAQNPFDLRVTHACA